MDTVDNTTGEITSNAVATVETHINPLDALMARLGGNVKIVQVTRSVLQQVVGVPIAVRFEGAAYEGEELQAGKGSGTKMAPARLANIVNLATGEKQSLIMNTVLEGELVRNFGKVDESKADKTGMGATGSYVGRSFVIGSTIPVGPDGKAKRYRVYQIAELLFDGAETAENVKGADVVATGADPVARDGKSKPKG